MVRHGLRTLLKKAHPGALELLGFPPASLAVTPPRLDRTVVELPGELGFDFAVSNTGPAEARLAVDYVVHYAKANGTRAEKVFKLGTADPGPGRVPDILEAPRFPPDDHAASTTPAATPCSCRSTGSAIRRKNSPSSRRGADVAGGRMRVAATDPAPSGGDVRDWL